jgi:hypothetical protein
LAEKFPLMGNFGGIAPLRKRDFTHECSDDRGPNKRMPNSPNSWHSATDNGPKSPRAFREDSRGRSQVTGTNVSDQNFSKDHSLPMKIKSSSSSQHSTVAKIGLSCNEFCQKGRGNNVGSDGRTG